MSNMLLSKIDRFVPQQFILRRARRILLSLAKPNPLRLVLVFVGQVIVGLFENISLVALLPLLHVLLDKDAPEQSELSRFMSDALSQIGVPITLGGMLIFIVAIITLKAAIKGIVMIGSGLCLQRQSQSLRQDLARHLIQARWSYLLDQPAGRLANIMGVEIIYYLAAAAATLGLVSRSIQAAFYLATSLLVSWKLTLGALTVAILLTVLMLPILGIVRRASSQRTNLMNSVSSKLMETIQGIKALKSMARERHVIPLLGADNEQIYRTQRTTVIGSALRLVSIEPVLISALAIGLIVSVNMFQVQLPTLALLALLFIRMTNEFVSINQYIHQIGVHEGSIDVVENLLREAERNQEVMHSGKMPTLAKGIEFARVDLSYGEKKVLTGVDLTIPAKKLTVVVGPSGSGKTSLLDAIVGFVDPVAGRVEIDGVPLKKIDLKAWREKIGYVPQELFLFNDTIRSNITLGDLSLDDKDVEGALRAVEAWDFIQSLPDGLDTNTGERGMRLSGGQRQRLSIARALVRQPKLLMLDEATSALDPETEQEICRMVRKLTKKFTVLAVTHQHAFLSVADQAIEIAKGKARALDLERVR